MKEFKLVKVLTHNIVMAQSDGKEYILMGKGIGFGKKDGDIIDILKIQTHYRIQNVRKMSEYQRLLDGTDENVIFATEEAISYAQEALGKQFNESIHISLLDHVNFAIYRYRNEISINDFFSDEYYRLYKNLYDIASVMIEMISESLEVSLPTYEVGAVMLHLHSAMKDGKVSTSALYAQIINESITFIKSELGVSFEDNPLGVSRFITHLKFALKRNEENLSLTNPIVDLLKSNYKESYQLSTQLGNLLEVKYGYTLNESEIGYIALHIYNIQHVSRKED